TEVCGQLRSCSGNNSRCQPAHLSSIHLRSDPISIPIQSPGSESKSLALLQPTAEPRKPAYLTPHLTRAASCYQWAVASRASLPEQPSGSRRGGVQLLLTAATAMAGVGSVVRRIYLAVYNWVVFCGWAQVLYYAVLALRETGHEAVYAAVERPLQFAQTAAIMEILHSLVGLVRSPVSATLPQIGSRLFLTWGVLWSFPETQSHILVTSLVISWSITEIIRYSFFGMKEAFGSAPSWLLWLRYSTFMLLYPTGISSEVGLIYTALPFMKASEKYCFRMPNKWNFSYDYYYTSILALLIYVPGSPHMYSYMLSQRRKALSKAKIA
ncbi:unnamed protein product, partial [Urochloa humidicola]